MKAHWRIISFGAAVLVVAACSAPTEPTAPVQTGVVKQSLECRTGYNVSSGRADSSCVDQ